MSFMPTQEPVKSADDVNSRVNFSVPVAVEHDASRGGGQRWNDGIGNNEGVIISVTRDMAKLGSVTAYGGGVLGRFDNSEGRMSTLAGVVVGARVPITKSLEGYAEVMAGGINGYSSQRNNFNEKAIGVAAAVTAGVNYAVTDKVSIGVSNTMFPATLAGSPANAYTTNVGVSVKF